MKLRILFISALVMMAGCSTTELVNVEGRYYIVGDEYCRKYLPNEGKLACFTEKEIYQGDRFPMTNQQMQMHLYNRARMDRLGDEMMRMGQTRYSVQCYTVSGITTCY